MFQIYSKKRSFPNHGEREEEVSDTIIFKEEIKIKKIKKIMINPLRMINLLIEQSGSKHNPKM